MIGDYVTFKDCQNEDAPTIVKIEGLGYQGRGVVEEALVTIDDDEYGFDLVEIDDEFVGIPLTVELLKNNGFRDIGGVLYDENGKTYELSLYRLTDSIWQASFHTTGFCMGDERKFVEYLHELQHFIRSCHIEKEFVI